MRWSAVTGVVVVVVVVVAATAACRPSKARDDRESRAAHVDHADKRGTATRSGGERGTSHEGRTIAPTCSHLGADWLDRPDREAREQPERVLDLLGVGPGMTVADVGAGTGYFTVRIARRVGASGRVLATDVQPEMLAMLDERVARARLSNVRTIRATEHTAELPAACCDLVLLVDVYHELADPSGVMSGVRAALKPHGRLALVEYRGEDPDVPIKPVHKMTLEQIRRELTGHGFRIVETIEGLPDQRIVVLSR